MLLTEKKQINFYLKFLKIVKNKFVIQLRFYEETFQNSNEK